MKLVNQGRKFVTDPVDVIRTAVIVETEDVGSVMGMYLGQVDYTFEPKDVGRLLEVTQNMSPGFMSWSFGSIFCELRKQYPDPFPYLGAVSAKE